MRKSLLTFITLVGFAVVGWAEIPELVQTSGHKFEFLKLKEMPTYHPARKSDGGYESLTRKDLLVELRMITSLPLNERGSSLLPPPLPRVVCRYESYSAVDHEWFQSFNEWFHRELQALDLTYRKEDWDCDDFSMALNAMADLALLRSREHPAPHLIGRLIVDQANPWAGVPTGGSHELIIFRSEDGWFVAEPQNRQVASLWDYPNRTHIKEILFN